jgi:serine/threonine-protein kinase
MSDADTDRLIGTEIAGVTLLSLQGRGHTGLVFVGFQKSLKRKIAVKLVPMEKATAQSFMDEAEVIAVLNHPNIVTVFDVGEYNEYLYITMQLIEGDSLQSLLKRKLLHPVPSQRGLDAAATLPIMAAALDALEYGHRQGVIHQDIKPGNILIENASGRPYVVDFGIARTELTEDKSKFVHGTPLYMPPEQARGHVTDPRADIFAVGVTIWECLAGVLPAQQLPAIKLVGLKARNPETFFLKRPSESSARIDAHLEHIILKATAPDREQRYADCNQFRNDLRMYADDKLGMRI